VPRFEIHRRAHVLRERVEVNECVRSEQSCFFSVVYQQDNRVPRRRKRLEGARNLQYRSDAGAVVGIARAGRNRIVVRREQHGTA
jgi:hypothetical protein